MFKELFYKNALIKVSLIDAILSGSIVGTMFVEQVADEFGVNLNTIKKVFRELNELGYLETKKKSGTKVRPEIYEEKIKKYKEVKTRFQNLCEVARDFGFSELEIFSCLVSSFNEFYDRQDAKKVILVDKDYYNLWAGKVELEEILDVKVVSILLRDAINFFKNQKPGDKLIITTYYCQPLLEDKGIKVFPLKVTPPIDQLIDFNTISEDSKMVFITISNELKERLKSRYKTLQQRFKYLKFATIQEILEDKNLLEDKDIVFVLKNFYEEHNDIFKDIKKIIIYSRFYDDEGITLLKKSILEENA